MRAGKSLRVLMVFCFMSMMLPCYVDAQEAVPVMTLANGTQVSMTASQLQALAAQPGITISATPTVAATQVAIPVPASLGGGFIVGEPAAVASGLNAVGVTTGATSASVAGASAVAGNIAAGGAVTGAAVAGGITAGTVAIGAAAVAGIAAGVAAATSNDNETPAAHVTPAHH